MPDSQSLMKEVQSAYPPLAKHDFSVTTGSGPYYSEMYPPWESQNPSPSKPTIMLHEKGQALNQDEQKQLLLGETFHYLGARNPETQVPVDPNFRMLKELFMQNLTPQQLHIDRQHFIEQMKNTGETRSFQDWMDQSQVDAYLRGHLSPINETERRDWAKTYTPNQLRILGQMKDYLTTGTLHP